MLIHSWNQYSVFQQSIFIVQHPLLWTWRGGRPWLFARPAQVRAAPARSPETGSAGSADVQVLPDQLRLEPLSRSRDRDGRQDWRDRGDVRASAGGRQAARRLRNGRLPRDLVENGRQAMCACRRGRRTRPADFSRRQVRARSDLLSDGRALAGAQRAWTPRSLQALAVLLRSRRAACARELRARRDPLRRYPICRRFTPAPKASRGARRSLSSSMASIPRRR